MIRLLDLDNCISNDEHRAHVLDDTRMRSEVRWNTYHQLSAFDTLANADLLDTMEEIIILTGRPVFWAPMTKAWLTKHGVRYKHLLMRNDFDKRPSVDLKCQHIEWLVQLYDVALLEITSAFDDRQDVVDMYRRHGINAHVRHARSDAHA